MSKCVYVWCRYSNKLGEGKSESGVTSIHTGVQVPIESVWDYPRLTVMNTGSRRRKQPSSWGDMRHEGKTRKRIHASLNYLFIYRYFSKSQDLKPG